jgi:KDO2-lipid IV(A) lauroyltransferase
MRPEDFPRHIDGLDSFAESVGKLRADGKGVILVTAHFGNWEWCNSCARTLGLEGGSIARPLDNPRVNEFVRSIRERNGMRIFDKAGAIRKALGALRNNNLVGVLIDQDAGVKGLMSPFLGHPASTITVPVELAIRVGCPMIVAGLRRNGGAERKAGAKRFTMLFNPEPYRPDPEADPEAEARRLTDALNAGLGEMILQAPEQWFWIHRRWKNKGKK